MPSPPLAVPWVELQALKQGKVSIAFATSLVAFPALALSVWWWNIQRFCKPPEAKAQHLGDITFDALISGLQLALGYILAVFLTVSVGLGIVMLIVAVGVLSSFGTQLILTQGPNVKDDWRQGGRVFVTMAVVLAMLIVPFLPAFNGQTGIAKAFEALGLTVPHATVAVSAPNLQRLERMAAHHDRPLQVCRNADGSGMLTDTRVLWHGLGSTGLVELWPEPTDPNLYNKDRKPRFDTTFFEQLFQVLGWRGVRVPLDNAGFTPMTGSRLHCMELSGLLFGSDSAALGDEARRSLAQQLAALKERLGKAEPAQTMLRIDIAGHADPRQRQRGTNEVLAQQRAQVVRQAVVDWISLSAPEWNAAKVELRSEGAREPARKCDFKDAHENEACHAFNRRVVLRLTAGEPV